MKRISNSIQAEIRVAKRIWCGLGSPRLRDLRALLVRYKFSLTLGEITRIDGHWYVTTLLGLTSLWINRGPIVTPEINHRRAVFVIGRIDEILSWEKTKEQEKDVCFVELGEY